MRGLASILLFHFLVVTFAPGWVVADFWLEQDRIAQELCVQRMVPEETRACHGECHLKKQLEQTTDEHEQNVPEQLRTLRITEMIMDQERPSMIGTPLLRELGWVRARDNLTEGHPQAVDPVPWG